MRHLFGSEKYETTLQEIATECAERLKQEDIEALRFHLSYSYHHFGYGLYLRNHCLDKLPDDCFIDRDWASGEIYKRIIPIVFPEFGSDQEIVARLLNESFSELNAHYYLKTGHMIPSDFSPSGAFSPLPEIDYDTDDWDEFHKQCDAQYEIEEMQFQAYIQPVLQSLWNEESFRTLSAEIGYQEEDISEAIKVCRDMWEEEHIFLPYEILFAKNPTELSLSHFFSVSKHMEWFFKSHSREADKLPAYIYKVREVADLAVSNSGNLLEYAPDFKNDYDLVLAAVTDDPKAIMFAGKKLQQDMRIIQAAAKNSRFCLLFDLPCMKKYNDDDVIVKMALEANGANICKASNRIRDDYDMAAFALQHQCNYYPDSAFPSLSEKLRDNTHLALLELSSPCPSMSDFSARLKDCDEIAEFLVTHEDCAWLIYNMSKRIKKKFYHRLPERQKMSLKDELEIE